MMQRLLRGRLFYVVMGSLMAGFYAYALMSGQAKVQVKEWEEQSASAEAQPHSVDIFPAAVDDITLRQLAKEKPAIAFVAFFASLITTVIACAGVVVTAWAVFSGRLKTVWQFPKARLTSWSMHELGRIVLLVLLAAGFMPFVRLAFLHAQPEWELDVHLWTPVAMALLDIFIILAILVFAEGKRKAGAWEAVGFVRKFNKASLRLGVRSYIVAFPWLVLLLYALIALANQLHLKIPEEPIQELIFQERRSWVFMITVLLACVLGPLAEECFFRGVLYPAVCQKTSRWVAMLVSGGLFGAIHMNWIGFLPIAFLGCLLAYIYERTGSLTGSFLVHAAHNSLLLGSTLVFRYITPAP